MYQNTKFVEAEVAAERTTFRDQTQLALEQARCILAMAQETRCAMLGGQLPDTPKNTAAPTPGCLAELIFTMREVLSTTQRTLEDILKNL